MPVRKLTPAEASLLSVVAPFVPNALRPALCDQVQAWLRDHPLPVEKPVPPQA